MPVSPTARASGQTGSPVLSEHVLCPVDTVVYRQVLFAQLSDWSVEVGGGCVLTAAGQGWETGWELSHFEPREPTGKAGPAVR